MPMEEGTEANPNKFVIRKLPPNLCESDFHKMLTDVCQDELEWFRFHPGSFITTGIRTSTAFIKLKHPELAPILSQVLQQTPFSGEHGVQYHCEMAVALFQKVPKEREKQDPYMGTYKEDPFYDQFLKEIEEEDEEMSKGPTVSATTTIPEEPPKETIITPLMQHVIDAHNPKVISGRRQRTSSSAAGRIRETTREKENQKKSSLPAIAESTRGEAKGGLSGLADRKKVRERKTGKASTGNTAANRQTEASAAVAQKKGKGCIATAESDTATRSANKRDSRRDTGKVKSEKGAEKQLPGDAQTQGSKPLVPNVGDLVAAQAVARAAVALAATGGGAQAGNPAPSTDTEGGSSQAGGASGKNGAQRGANGESRRSGKEPRKRSGRGKRTSGSVPDNANSKALSNPRTSDATSISTSKSTPTAADRMAQAAAAAAAAALGDSKPLRRPALASRGVRDALSRAGIRKSSSKVSTGPGAADDGS